MSEPYRSTTTWTPRRSTTGALHVDQPGRPRLVVAVDRSLLLGRDDSSDVVLHSDRVSRRHARVWPLDGGLAVEDLGSRNGTRVNGQPVQSATRLLDGDTLTLGDVDIECSLPRPEADPRATGSVQRDADRASDAPAGAAGAAGPEDRSSSGGHGTKTLVLAVLESLVGTAFSQAVGTGIVGTYAFAAITPLLGTIFALRKDGRARAGAVVVVTTIAVVVTVVGVTAADTALGRSVFPWSTSGRTFVPPPDGGTEGATKLVMPKLVGENIVSAAQLLDRYGFDRRNVLFGYTPSSSKWSGQVARTEPAAGTKVPADAIVRVYIGSGGRG